MTTISNKIAVEVVSQSNVLVPTIRQYPISGPSELAQCIPRLLHQCRNLPATRRRACPSPATRSRAQFAAARPEIVRLPPNRPKSLLEMLLIRRFRGNLRGPARLAQRGVTRWDKHFISHHLNAVGTRIEHQRLTAKICERLRSGPWCRDSAKQR